MRLGAVVLNYKNYKETITCVESLLKQTDIEMEIVIVDNGSHNESLVMIKKQFTSRTNIKIIESEINLGYANGNNLGITLLREMGIVYILVVNSDITFSTHRILNQLILASEDKVGILIPIIKNRDGTIDQRVTYKARFLYLRLLKAMLIRIMRPLGYKEKNSESLESQKKREQYRKLLGTQYDYFTIAGSAYILTPSFFENYNKLYPKTFLYCEEWGLIIYLRKAGLYSKIVETDTVWHKGAASTGNKMKAGTRERQLMVAESAKQILKLLFLPRSYISWKYK